MRTLTFAVSGNNRLGANLLALLHDVGHMVQAADTQPGPLLDMAQVLGIAEPGTTHAAAAPLAVEWRVRCGTAERAGDARYHAGRTLEFHATSTTFPPATVSIEWRSQDRAGAVRQIAGRAIELTPTLCGADMVAEIEATAEELFAEIVSLLGRDALNENVLPTLVAADQGGALTLDLRALAGWHATNQTARPFELDPSLPEMVSRTARATPEAIALHDEHGTVTYRTFVGAAMKLAGQLAAGAPAPGVLAAEAEPIPRVIAVRLRKSSLLYVAILGAIGSGAAYLPLDPSFPAERVRLILEQSHADCLITDDTFDAAALHGLPVNIVRLTQLDAAGVDIQRAAWPVEADPDRLRRCAITIFTSGSTGVPKGVMLTHRNIVHFCHWYRDYIELNAASRVLQFCTVAFDVSLLDIFPTFLAGSTLVIPTEEQRHALDDLSRLIAERRLTHAFLPPALLAVMPPADWPDLKHLLTGGDICFPETIARFGATRQFHNIFGPAECTVLVTIARLQASDNNRMIGRPTANVRCYVLDESGHPVRTGEAGELCVAGAGVADGYLRRADLSRERFVPNPYASADGVWPNAHNETLYRSGDIVQWDKQGALHFIGRRDAQVKIRGFRVELGEIENAALATNLFSQCACVVDERKRIRIFVSKPRDETVTADALRAALAVKLPDYMLPHEAIELDALPATNNGKIDRGALAQIPSQRAAAAARDGEPANPTERQLRALWATLLDLDEPEIGRHDSFFDLGGHSLLVSRLMLAVKRQMAGNAPLARFMERPTIEALASLLTDRDRKKGDRIPPRVFADMRLPDEIRPLDGLRPDPRNLANVLLTGANGFLGSFIAAELIEQTDATVWCLIRAKNDEEGRARLDTAFRTNGLPALAGHPRLKVVTGDLAEDRLGLSKDTWQQLAERIDAIYHNGAHVNHVYDYPFLYRANVASTLELLRLACERRNKSLHFVSTLSAASATDSDGKLIEDGPSLDAPAFVNNGYNVTKWVSEHLVWEAAQRGIDATILRPGNITGVARSGLCLPDRNRVLLLVKGSLQLGFAPAGDTAFDFSPVDFLARAIVLCSIDPQREQRAFHFQNPQPLTWEGYLGTLSRLGYLLALEDPAVWRDRLMSIDESNALFDVVAFYLDDSQEDIGDMARIEHHVTATTLDRLGLAYPEKDAALLDAHFGYLVTSGFLPVPPPASASASTKRKLADVQIASNDAAQSA
ncbi:amino acid adenylation domain-containing protein [Paraburkholderia sp. BCC1876]|uniref:amino acid adenylation domain-containing protein n=1 Tax=Paraburkholderia sp. BCC1876 TaxID=2676303 RepID=UPI001590C6EE|nr:amino acid adenylation domain-containing protein [Paraburkholderia sp. BCC1876]